MPRLTIEITTDEIHTPISTFLDEIDNITRWIAGWRERDGSYHELHTVPFPLTSKSRSSGSNTDARCRMEK